MPRAILNLPLLVILMGLSSLTMYVPAAHAVIVGPMWVARPFFYGGSILLICTAMLAIATENYRPRDVGTSQLLAFVGAFFVLPPMLALPFHQAMPHLSFVDIWFDMTSALTTTGFDTFAGQAPLPNSIHLWRTLVGWMGGLLILVGAGRILALFNLGGAEIMNAKNTAQKGIQLDSSQHLVKGLFIIFPVYGAATVLLWLGLIISGETQLTAFCHALATISTSGLSPVGGMAGTNSPFLAEMLVFIVLALTLSRRFYGDSIMITEGLHWVKDPELRLAATVIVSICALMFSGHFLALSQTDAVHGILPALGALWGFLFTSLSFMTTTGFISQHWPMAQAWSGLDNPSLILIALAVMGGGVATTAGGIKLLRAAALFTQVGRELDRIILPNSVGGRGKAARQLRREGAQLAWIYMMLISFLMVFLLLCLSLIGLNFENSMPLTLAAFSNTGPLLSLSQEAAIALVDLSILEKALLGLAMILGRLEVLALVAVLMPRAWQA